MRAPCNGPLRARAWVGIRFVRPTSPSHIWSRLRPDLQARPGSYCGLHRTLIGLRSSYRYITICKMETYSPFERWFCYLGKEDPFPAFEFKTLQGAWCRLRPEECSTESVKALHINFTASNPRRAPLLISSVSSVVPYLVPYSPSPDLARKPLFQYPLLLFQRKRIFVSSLIPLLS